MNWKKRYSHSKDYDVNVNWDDQHEVAAHMIGAHRNSYRFDNDDQRKEHDDNIVEMAKSRRGRYLLKNQSHDFLHSRGFLMKGVDHNHSDQEFKSMPEWSKIDDSED